MSIFVEGFLLTKYSIFHYNTNCIRQKNGNVWMQSWESKVGNVGVRGLIRYDSSAAENKFLQSFFVRR